MDKDNRELVAAAIAGDQDAQLALFDAARPNLEALARRKMGAAAVEDVVSEVLTRALADLPNRDPDDLKVSEWLRTILINYVIDEQRRTKPVSLQERQWRSFEQDGLGASLYGDRYEPDLLDAVIEQEATKERNERVHQVIGRLPDDAATLLRMRLAGRTRAEMAAHFGIDDQKIKTQMSRAFRLFREAWGQ